MKQVLLTHDSFASHTTLNSALKDELRLNTKYIGDLNIQTYSGVVEEKGYQTTAVIDDLGGRKVDFIVSNCQQSIPEYQYDIPAAWKRK